MQSRAGPAAVFVELRQEGEESSRGRGDLAGESADFGAELLYVASGGIRRFFIDQCRGIGQFCGIGQLLRYRSVLRSWLPPGSRPTSFRMYVRW